ncbi:sensor histidine kinase, partial [Kaarinaea lacus]
NSNAAILILRDNGPGISPEALPYVFDRFYRADKSRSRSEGGTGLGLAISKQFSKLLGGDITVHSEIDKGTVFTVFLPRIVRENSTYDRNLRNFNHRRNRSASVFVLENQDSLRQKLQVMLIDKGFEANGSSFDENGIEASATVSPDVIIRNAEFDDNAIRELYNHYCDYQYASIPVILESISAPENSGSVLCYHEYFPNMPFLSLVNLYENTQHKGLVLLSEDASLVTSLKQAHEINEAIDLIDKSSLNLLLLDPVHVVTKSNEQLSLFLDAVYKSNIRLAIINPKEAGYKGFLDNMRALTDIVKKTGTGRRDVSKLILDNVVNTVRKDTIANLLDIRSSYDKMSVDQDKRINEQA